MELLVTGILLWSLVHFIPTIGISFKTSFTNRFGQTTYTVLFSFLIILSLILIVLGWRNSTPIFLYALPAIVKPIAFLMIIVAFFLFGAAKHPTRIKRVIRHPQLSSVIVWSSAHLLLNGDSRSVVLFGSLGIWAILEIILINKREGAYVKPAAPSWKKEITGGFISIAILIIAVSLHPYIAGVPAR